MLGHSGSRVKASCASAVFGIVASLGLMSCADSAEPEIAALVETQLTRMTLEQKVAQMIQGEIKHVTPDDVRKYGLGSVLNGGGSFPADNKHASVAEWVALADEYYAASVDQSQVMPVSPLFGALTLCTATIMSLARRSFPTILP